MGPTDVGPFIPLQSEPAEAFFHFLFCGRFKALTIRIFDAEDERAPRLAGNDVVVEGRARTTDVKAARGRRGETNAGRKLIGHGVPSVVSERMMSVGGLNLPHGWREESAAGASPLHCIGGDRRRQEA